MPQFPAVIELSTLNGANGFRLDGQSPDSSGFAVAPAGDVNGDGFDDLLVGAYLAYGGGPNAKSTYVVFGSAAGFAATTNLTTMNGTNGFLIGGDDRLDMTRVSVSAAGDINGDGFDDVIIGNYWADKVSYVVFGKASGFSPEVDVTTLNGANGFRIDGAGNWVGGGGDINGDGLADMILGNRFAGTSGSAYVVFGKAAGFGAAFNVAALNGANGFRLNGVNAGDDAGFNVANAGDVNNDGFDDVIVGAPNADPHGGSSGSSYVIFGKAGGFAPSINLSSLNGANGFRLDGAAAGDTSGLSVETAGDVNADGFADIIIGAQGADGSRGAAYVAFGKAGGFAAASDLSSLNGANGFKMVGVAAGERLGISAASAGDVNGDGYDDIIVGADSAQPHGAKSGSTYVIFGKAGGFAPLLNLAALNGPNGFRLNGVAAGDLTGGSVSSAGDVNHDGYDDLMIGATYTQPNGFRSGSTYIVFGNGINVPPVITSNGGGGTAAVSAAENATLVTALSATDTNQGQTLAWTIIGGENKALFHLVNGNQLHFLAAPDFESPPGAGATPGYQVTVEVADSLGGTDAQKLTVAVANVGGETWRGAAGRDLHTGTGEEDTLSGGGNDDRIDGAAGNDAISGGDGNDTLIGGLGNDLMGGAAGSDSLDGGGGNDSLSGGDGHDVLRGGAGNDRIRGDGGGDVLTGGVGDDWLSGGSGHDRFVFRSGFGNDVIVDFDRNWETIQFATSAFANFAAVKAAAAQVGQDVVITHGANHLTIERLQLATLAADDFSFFV